MAKDQDDACNGRNFYFLFHLYVMWFDMCMFLT